jgi:diadenosine tetraphosphate (Ap4A) HIT family hydrolase
LSLTNFSQRKPWKEIQKLTEHFAKNYQQPSFRYGKDKRRDPKKKDTHTHTHFQSPDDQNTAHIAVATTKAIYLEEDIFTHKKNHTTLQKKPQQKAHLRPSLPHKITQPQN